MRKKILVATPFLNSGGVEISLIRFLDELIKKNDFIIDLYLLMEDGPFLTKVPTNVNIHTIEYIDEIYNYNNRFNYIKHIKGLKKKILFFIYRLKLKKALLKNDWNEYYNIILLKTNDIDENYDLAIDYHGYGHFISAFVANKVKASKKVMWIHDEKSDWLSKVSNRLKYYDKIFAVGESCKNSAIRNCPQIKNKIEVFYNMSDFENIRKKSGENVSLPYKKNQINILTIGRLEWQKGYDIALETAKILKEKKLNFCWYVLGQGTLEKQIQEKIKYYGLNDNFKLLGIKSNPYPYLKACDIFVLTSRHEGYCLATLEAKVLFKPIVATNIESNTEQIKDGFNGYLCELDPKKFSDRILYLINNKKQMDKFRKNLSNENFDFSNELEKIYKLMEE